MNNHTCRTTQFHTSTLTAPARAAQLRVRSSTPRPYAPVRGPARTAHPCSACSGAAAARLCSACSCAVLVHRAPPHSRAFLLRTTTADRTPRPHSVLFQRILADFAADFNCEVTSQAMINDVANLTRSLLVLKRMVGEATRDLERGELNERLYQMMGHNAQIARESGAFASGSFGDLLFSVIKTAVSCANTGQELFANIASEHRCGRLVSRLNTLQFDIDLLLSTPVLL